MGSSKRHVLASSPYSIGTKDEGGTTGVGTPPSLRIRGAGTKQGQSRDEGDEANQEDGHAMANFTGAMP